MADASGMTPTEPMPAADDKPWHKRIRVKLPKRVWTITDVVGISDDAWSKLAWIATIVGFVAVATNFSMVVAYAAGVARDAPMLVDPGSDFLKQAANAIVGVGQVFVAGMLQLGTDFCLLFAAGLAKSKYRFTPTAALILWCICAANTLEMKQDIYESIRDGRIEQQQIAEEKAAPADVQAAKKLIASYADKDAPPTQEASNAVIDTAGQTISDLQNERAEKVAARGEEAQTGRESRWQAHDTRIQEIDRLLTSERTKITTARVSLAERVAFDGATAKATEWDTRPKLEVSKVGYDDQWAIDLRVWGLSLLSFVSILVAFAADKASYDRKKEEEEKRKRSEAAQKAANTRWQNKNTFEGEFTEGAPINAGSLPNLDIEPSVVAKADTPTRRKADPDKHPDKTGDDYGARENGYGGGVNDGT